MGSSRPPVTLADAAVAAAAHVSVSRHGADVAVTDVHMDSRAVTPGSIYVAIRGARADGHDFIDAALQRGAAALVVDRPVDYNVPYLLTEDTRAVLGWIAAAVHRWPADLLDLIGITGTNGKTTVAHMLAAMAGASGREMAVIGTVSANLDDLDNSPRTTPEASDLQRMLRHLADRGRITDVAIEVSSHAMEMGRINGTLFGTVAFTNLSQDHLDYHETMEEYYAAKARLFQQHWAPHGVIWIGDEWSLRLASESAIPVVRVGTGPNDDVTVTYREDTPTGSSFDIDIAGRTRSVRTALAGRFNVANAAVALTCAHLHGWDIDGCVERLASMQPIPGRYNTIDNKLGFWVVVDYAHSPDSMEATISQTRKLVAGKIIAIGGAGGDRDQEKRPLMGAALAMADTAIITTDNPRSENPQLIEQQVLAGIADRSNVLVEADRRLAIRAGLSAATPGDAVLILGKGHETGQEFADVTLPFDDASVAVEELRQLGEER